MCLSGSLQVRQEKSFHEESEQIKMLLFGYLKHGERKWACLDFVLAPLQRHRVRFRPVLCFSCKYRFGITGLITENKFYRGSAR